MEEEQGTPILPPQPVLETPILQKKKSKLPLVVILVIVILLIGIGGVYAGMRLKEKQRVEKSSPEVVPTTGVEPSLVPTLAPTVDEAANWKTYANTKFSVKYPDNWISYQTGDMVKFQTFSEPSPGYGGFPGGENDIQVSFSVAENANNLTLQKYFEKLSQGRIIKSKESISVNGISAIKTSYEQEVGAGMPEIYFIGGNNTVEANVASGGTTKDKALIIFDQILSTFKFLDSNSTGETTNWQTYENTEYGFEFKYPSDFFVYQGEPQRDAQYWSNEADGGSPLDLDDKGIWLNMSFATDSIENIDFYKKIFNLKANETIVSSAVIKLTDLNTNGTRGAVYYQGLAPDFVGEAAYGYEAVWMKGNTVYRLSFDALKALVVQQQKKLFDQILSTFKFID